MGNETEIVFKVDAPGTARAALRQVDGLMDTIGSSAVAAGVKLDKSLVDSLAKMSPRALEQINAELAKMPANASKAAQAINRVPGGAQAGMDAQFNAFKTGAERTNKINEANGAVKNLAENSAKASHNLSRVQNALFNISGIPHSNALEQIAGIGGIGGGPIILLGAVAVGLKLINDVFTGIREESEKLLKTAEKFNQINQTGMKGGSAETKTDLEAIRNMRDEVNKLIKSGFYTEAMDLQKKQMGRVMTGAEMDSKFDQAERRAKAMGVDIRDPKEIERMKLADESRKKETDYFNEQGRLRMQMADLEWDAKQKQFAADKAAALERIEALKKEQEMKIRLNDLFGEGEKLRAGLGGQDLRAKADAENAARGEALSRLREAQMGGDEGARRAALSQYEKLVLGGQSTGDRLDAEAKERQLSLLQQQAATGVGPAKQLALEQLIAATSNTGSLTSDQVDIRLKAIEELTRELRDVAKALSGKQGQVEITLKDESGGALKAQLGEAPTPQNSGVYGDNSRTISDWAPSTRATGF